MINPDELILVSVDDHICEPRGMFDAHVPVRYRDQAPRVVEEDDGVEQWWYGDLRGRNLGLNAAAGKPREYFNVDASRYDEMRPGCFDVHERVRDMNAGGQLAGLNFPNWTGFAGRAGVERRAAERDHGPRRRVGALDVRGAPLGDVLGALPDAQVLAHRGRHRLDPVLPGAL